MSLNRLIERVKSELRPTSHRRRGRRGHGESGWENEDFD